MCWQQFVTDLLKVALLRFRSYSSGEILKLFGSGPDMAAELKDRDREEGGSEGGLPHVRESMVARLQGFGDLFCLVAGACGDGFKDLHAFTETNRCVKSWSRF